MHIFLTGPLQSGKSTAIARYLAGRPESPGGFRTRWDRAAGRLALELLETGETLSVATMEPHGVRADRAAFDAAGERLLSAQIRELEERIDHLRTMKLTLVSRHQDMMALLHLDLSEISVVRKEKSCLAVVPVEQELPTAADVEQVIGAVKRYSLQRLHDAVYGSMIAVDQLQQGRYGR